MRELIVQTSQNACARERLVFLDEDCIDPQSRELLPMIRLEEATARILEDLRLDYAQAGQLGIDSFQARMFSATLTIVDTVPHSESFPVCQGFYPLDVRQIPSYRLLQTRFEA